MITQMDKKEETRGTETRKKGPENVPKLTPRGSVRVKGTKKVPTISKVVPRILISIVSITDRKSKINVPKPSPRGIVRVNGTIKVPSLKYVGKTPKELRRVKIFCNNMNIVQIKPMQNTSLQTKYGKTINPIKSRAEYPYKPSNQNTTRHAHAQNISYSVRKIWMDGLKITDIILEHFTELILSIMDYVAMATIRKSAAIQSYAIETSSTHKLWERQGVGLSGKARLDRGRKILRMTSEGEVEKRTKIVYGEVAKVNERSPELEIRKTAKRLRNLREGFGTTAMKSQIIGVLAECGIRPVTFYSYEEAKHGQRLNFVRIFLAGATVLEVRHGKLDNTIKIAKDKVCDKLAREAKDRPDSQLHTLEILTTAWIAKHQEVAEWQIEGDKLQRGERKEVVKLTKERKDKPGLKAPEMLDGEVSRGKGVAGRKLRLKDWELLPTSRRRGSVQDLAKTSGREAYRELLAERKLSAIFKATNILEEHGILEEVWEVKRDYWEGTLGKIITARVIEGLEFALMVGIDSEGKGAKLQLSLLSVAGVFTVVFDGFWMPVNIRKILREYKPVLCCDDGDDISLVVGNPWDFQILDPALLHFELEGWGKEGRTGVQHLGEGLGIPMLYVKKEIEKDMKARWEVRKVRYADWEKIKVLEGYKLAYCAVDSEIEVMAVLKMVLVMVLCTDHSTWPDNTTLMNVLDKLQYGQSNMTVDSEMKLLNINVRNIEEGTAGQTVSRKRAYALADKKKEAEEEDKPFDIDKAQDDLLERKRKGESETTDQDMTTSKKKGKKRGVGGMQGMNLSAFDEPGKKKTSIPRGPVSIGEFMIG